MKKVLLRDFMVLLGYGTHVIVVLTDTDEELLHMENFHPPYALKYGPEIEYEVECFGMAHGALIVWVKEAEIKKEV